MSQKLSERFRASQGAPIDLGGREIIMMWELDDLSAGDSIRIQFDPPQLVRPQALRVKSRRGTIGVNGESLTDVVLWSDSAPASLEILAEPKSPGGSLNVRVWNAWRDEEGTMQAWIGNAGIVVEEAGPGTVMLRCSDGFDEPTFDDLIAKVEVVRSR